MIRRAITTPCRRLHTIALHYYLRFRKAEAEWVAVQIEADMLAGPANLAQLRADIQRFEDRLRALEVKP